MSRPGIHSYSLFVAVHYLVQFYCDRLKDRAVIIPQVLAGLHALVSGCVISI